MPFGLYTMAACVVALRGFRAPRELLRVAYVDFTSVGDLLAWARATLSTDRRRTREFASANGILLCHDLRRDGSVTVPKKFIVLMTARSGSTWLITLLNGQPGVAAYEELMMPVPVNPKYAFLAENAPERFIARRSELRGLRPVKLNRYLVGVESFRPEARACGFKINLAQVRGMPDLLPVLAYRGYRLIVLVRDNVFESSVSQIMTRIGGDAHGVVPADQAMSVEIDPNEVVDRMRRRMRWIEAMRTIRRLWPLPAIEISYEGLIEDQAAVLESILRVIGLDTPPVAVKSPLKRRIDRPYDQLIANYAEVTTAVEAAGLVRYLPRPSAAA